MRIRTKFLLTQIVLIVVIGGGIGLIALINSSNALTNHLEQQLEEKVADNRQYLEERFQRSFAELDGLAKNEVVRSMNLEKQLDYLEGELANLDYLTLAIVTPDGTSHYIDGSTADLADRDYIISAFDGVPAMSEVILSRATNELVMMVATPIERDQEVVGVLIARIDGYYLSDVIDSMSFGDTGYAFILNEEGTFLAHGNRELVQDQVNYIEEGGENGETVSRFISSTSGQFSYNYENIQRAVAFDTLDNGWTLVVGAHESEYTSHIKSLQTLLAILVVGALIIGVVITYFIANSISRPINYVTESGEKLADGDFTIEIPEHYRERRDEVGQLAQTFTTLLTNMRNMLNQVQQSARQVETAVDEMAYKAENTAEMTKETNELVDEVAETAELQLKSAEDSSVAMSEMAIGSERVAVIATEVSESSNEIHQQANEGQKLIERSVGQMENIEQGTQTTSDTINKLQQTSGEINEITQIITDIAEQTNLLALNASIEAARAGEAGSGFAVVAEEIRKLSEETASSALNINDLISNIQSETQVAVDTVERNQQDVEQGLELMASLRADFQNMFRFLDQTHSQMNDLSALAEEMSAGTAEVSSAVNETQEMTSNSTENIRQVTDKINAQFEMVEEIHHATKLLEQTANELKQSIQIFRI